MTAGHSSTSIVLMYNAPTKDAAVAVKAPFQRPQDHHDDISKKSPTASVVSSPAGTLKSELTTALEELALQQQKNKISVIIGFIVVVVSIAAIVAILIARLRRNIHTLLTTPAQGQRGEYVPNNFTALPEAPWLLA